MKSDINLCMSCMNPKTSEGDCEICGYSDKGVYLASYLPPHTLLSNRYVIGKLLSYNGESAVYAGYDELHAMKVVVKEYMPDILCSRNKGELSPTANSGKLPLYKTYLSEFIELNRSLQNLGNSVNGASNSRKISKIRKVLDVFTENSTAYAICEDASGTEFKRYLKTFDKPPTWEQAKKAFEPLFALMTLVNKAGIIHRGISPQTVLVSELAENENSFDIPEFRLTGFAISAARTYGSEIACELFAGYAAPELYGMSERQGSWTDVYSLCALLYKTLTGTTPPDSKDRALVDALALPNLINPNIPAYVSDAIMKGLELNFEKRIKTAGELASRLSDAYNSGEIALNIENKLNPANSLSNAPANVNSASKTSDDPENPKRVSENREAPNTSNPRPNRPNNNPNKPRLSKAERAALAKKRAKEKKKRIVGTIVISIIAAIAIFFTVLIVIAIKDPETFSNMFNKSDPIDEPTPYSAPPTSEPTTSKRPKQNLPDEDLINVPDFAGKKYVPAEFENAYTVAGVKLLEFIIEEAYDDEKQKGFISEQDIEPGTEVPYGTQITLTVSLGLSAVKLPDYAFFTAEEYAKLLEEAGILNYQIMEEESSMIPEGFVIACLRANGDEINVADEINVSDAPDVVIIVKAIAPPIPDDVPIAERPDLDDPELGDPPDGFDSWEEYFNYYYRR